MIWKHAQQVVGKYCEDLEDVYHMHLDNDIFFSFSNKELKVALCAFNYIIYNKINTSRLMRGCRTKLLYAANTSCKANRL